MAARHAYKINSDVYNFDEPIDDSFLRPSDSAPNNVGGTYLVPNVNMLTYAYVLYSARVRDGIVTWPKTAHLVRLVRLHNNSGQTLYYAFEGHIIETDWYLHFDQMYSYDVSTYDTNFLGTGKTANILINTAENNYAAVLIKVDLDKIPLTNDLLSSTIESKHIIGWPDVMLDQSGPYALDSSDVRELLEARERLLQFVRTNIDSGQKPDNWDQLNDMKSLRITNRYFTSLPPEIGLLTNLERLDLNRNRLTSLPPEIGRLAQLKDLNLSYNKITSLPAEIGQLANLEILNLGHNLLTVLPKDIGQLKRLRELYLDRNKLESLPAEIRQLVWLRYLDLNDNPLRILPPELESFTLIDSRLREKYIPILTKGARR